MFKFSIILLLFFTNTFATVYLDKSKFKALTFKPVEDAPRILRPEEVRYQVIGPTEILVKIFLRKNNIEKEIKTLDFPIPTCAKQGGRYEIERTLKNKYIGILKTNYYKISATIECGKENNLIFDHNSFGGQSLSIWDIANTAVNKFKKIDRLAFWKKRINVQWPGLGDFYAWGEVNITKGHRWDIVAHELGHAIYQLANIGKFGGGSHKIDQCYSHKMAISEGWASYFAAWLGISLDDPDAKFEYLVPRRAPIHIEHVPEDVCAGETNEWRVTSFLWDLIDRNDDHEEVDLLFKTLWDVTKEMNFFKTSQIAQKLKLEVMDPILLNILWENNFLKPL